MVVRFNCWLKSFVLILVVSGQVSCQSKVPLTLNAVKLKEINMENREVAILAGGCFWCIEAPLSLLDGVDTVVSGYIGGHVDNPTYAQVCTGSTGHAEAIKIVYNPQVITYAGLLEAFFLLHDPTQLNRQGNDRGTQYRSAIFPLDNKQEEQARYYLQALNDAKAYRDPIVTTIEHAEVFYPAEDYHQNYYANNSEEMYCQLVVKPKLEKFKKVFADKLKK